MYRKSVLLSLLVLVVIVGLIWFKKDKIEIKEFTGNVVSVTDESIIVRGIYIKDGNPAETTGKTREVEVRINQDTEIIRESFKIPKGVTSFRPDELPKQTMQVGLEQVKADSQLTVVGLIIRARNNIYGKDKFIADKIIYRVPDFNRQNQ